LILVRDLHPARRGARAVLTDDDQGRYLDRADAVGEVEARDRLTAADVAGRRRRADHPAHRLDDWPALLLERRSEPAVERALDQRLHPLRLRRMDALVPQRLGLRRGLAGGGGDDEGSR